MNKAKKADFHQISGTLKSHYYPHKGMETWFILSEANHVFMNFSMVQDGDGVVARQV